MKLLFDQNLSHKLAQRLANLFPGSAQVKALRLDQAADSALWDYARTHGYVLVTQDGDFSNLSALRGYPPKVVWLRCGNRPTAVIERLLRVHHARILTFLGDPRVGILEID